MSYGQFRQQVEKENTNKKYNAQSRRAKPNNTYKQSPLITHYRHIGNQAVQRLVAGEGLMSQQQDQPKPANNGMPGEEREKIKSPINTGMPDRLRSGLEQLSGIDISDVQVHYNSPKPARLHALAYTQGVEIHVAPGQVKHLPHEAWHMVQQKQGRVKPTMQMKGENINDDVSLEKEADIMGAKAAAGPGSGTPCRPEQSHPTNTVMQLVAGKTKLGLLRKLTPYHLNFTTDQLVYLAQALPNMDGMDIIHLGRISLLGGVTIGNIATIAQLLPGTSGMHIFETFKALNTLNFNQVKELIDAMVRDGLNGQNIRNMITSFAKAGLNPVKIQTILTDMRGNLLDLPPSPAMTPSRDITDVPAPPPAPVAIPVPAAHMPGSMILSATEINTHVAGTLAAGRPANNIHTQYPTGQPIAARSIDQLWTDCSINAITHKDINTTAPETPAQKKVRQKMALNQLMVSHPGQATIIQRIFSNKEGQQPRNALAPNVEDDYGAAAKAHIMPRHVFGPPPPIQDIKDLALRVTRHKVGKIPCPCPGVAGAFHTAGDAQAGMQKALNAAPWAKWRQELTLGKQIAEAVVAASTGTILELSAGGATKINAALLPPYAHMKGIGTNRLYEGDLTPGLKNPPLTKLRPLTKVFLRIHGNDYSPGGFYIHSAWPE